MVERLLGRGPVPDPAIIVAFPAVLGVRYTTCSVTLPVRGLFRVSVTVMVCWPFRCRTSGSSIFD
jgi:hypothetical protein